MSADPSLVELTSPPARRAGVEVRRVFDTVIGEITGGRLAPGSKLNEPELARSLGVSRGPLREAIRRLEERQLVRCTPNAGARVAMHTPREILAAYEIREALEGMAARLAAGAMTDDERRELRTVYEHEVAAARSRGFRSDFHMRIVQGTHNEQLARMLGEDHYHLHKFWRVNHRWLKVGGDASWQDHRRILEAIEFRDAECAEILMRRHVARLRLDSLEEIERMGMDIDEPGA